MIYITFIRHGTTDVNGMGYIATNIDISLNENGIKECIKNRFDDGRFNKVYCSPCKRTMETAKLIYPYIDAEQTDLIRQKEWGVLTNHFKKEYSTEYIKNLRNYEINPEGSESLEDVVHRLKVFFDKVKKENKNDSNILVVTHNGIIRVIKKEFLNTSEYEETKYLDCVTMTVENDL